MSSLLLALQATALGVPVKAYRRSYKVLRCRVHGRAVHAVRFVPTCTKCKPVRTRHRCPRGCGRRHG